MREGRPRRAPTIVGASTRQILRPLEDALCVQEDRVVGADNCVSWHQAVERRSAGTGSAVLSFA
jgi:hypothetical protein